jgi:hypothetical protein
MHATRTSDQEAPTSRLFVRRQGQPAISHSVPNPPAFRVMGEPRETPTLRGVILEFLDNVHDSHPFQGCG